MAHRIRFNREEGLTLIELLVVIVLVGVVSAIALPVLLNTIQSSQVKADAASASEIDDFKSGWATSGYIVLDATDPLAIAANTLAGGPALVGGHLYAFNNDGKGIATGAPAAQIASKEAGAPVASPVVMTQADYETWFRSFVLPEQTTVFVQQGDQITFSVAPYSPGSSEADSALSKMSSVGRPILEFTAGNTSDPAFQAAFYSYYGTGYEITPESVGLPDGAFTKLIQVIDWAHNPSGPTYVYMAIAK